MFFQKLFEQSDYNISVSTDILRDKAMEIKRICVDIQQHISQFENRINSSSYCWDSRSSELLRELHLEDKAEADKAVMCLHRQIEKLNLIISGYEKAEKASLGISENLPTDVFE